MIACGRETDRSSTSERGGGMTCMRLAVNVFF